MLHQTDKNEYYIQFPDLSRLYISIYDGIKGNSIDEPCVKLWSVDNPKIKIEDDEITLTF